MHGECMVSWIHVHVYFNKCRWLWREWSDTTVWPGHMMNVIVIIQMHKKKKKKCTKELKDAMGQTGCYCLQETESSKRLRLTITRLQASSSVASFKEARFHSSHKQDLDPLHSVLMLHLTRTNTDTPITSCWLLHITHARLLLPSLLTGVWGLAVGSRLQCGYVPVPAQSVHMLRWRRRTVKKHECVCVHLRGPVACQVTAAAQVLVQSLGPAAVLAYAQ